MSRQAVSDWMRGPAAARALGFETTKPVRRLAEKGLIGVLALPSAWLGGKLRLMQMK